MGPTDTTADPVLGSHLLYPLEAQVRLLDLLPLSINLDPRVVSLKRKVEKITRGPRPEAISCQRCLGTPLNFEGAGVRPLGFEPLYCLFFIVGVLILIELKTN